MTDDYESWPEITIRAPKAGGRLFTKYGNLVAYIDTKGNLQVLPDMDLADIDGWRAFGVVEPAEQRLMTDKITVMINKLRIKHNG